MIDELDNDNKNNKVYCSADKTENLKSRNSDLNSYFEEWGVRADRSKIEFNFNLISFDEHHIKYSAKEFFYMGIEMTVFSDLDEKSQKECIFQTLVDESSGYGSILKIPEKIQTFGQIFNIN